MSVLQSLEGSSVKDDPSSLSEDELRLRLDQMNEELDSASATMEQLERLEADAAGRGAATKMEAGRLRQGLEGAGEMALRQAQEKVLHQGSKNDAAAQELAEVVTKTAGELKLAGEDNPL